LSAVGDCDAARDDAYRAVGRYVVEFSRLMVYLRSGLERYLAVGKDQMAPSLVLGASAAEQITNACFSVCEHAVNLNEEELKVARRLRKEVLDEIKRRNDFAHGDWLLEGLLAMHKHPILSRVKPGRRSGSIEKRQLPIAEIDAASDELYALRQKVAEFCSVCLSPYPFSANGRNLQVRHVLAMDGYGVKRTSPITVTWM
jgi:hypothetical protein